MTLDGSGSSDLEGEVLTYAWTQIDQEGNAVTGDAAVTLSGANTASPTFAAPMQLAADLTLAFSLRVEDPGGLNATDTVTIIVTAGPNDAPTADAGDGQTVAEGAAVTLDGSGSSDPEKEPLAYAWTQIDKDGNAVTGDAAVALVGADAASPTFAAPMQLAADLTLAFSLRVEDPGGLNATDTVTIIVAVTPPKVLNAEEAKTAGLLPASTNQDGNIITLPTNEEVNVDNADPEDFTLSVNGDTAAYQVTEVNTDSIIMRMFYVIQMKTDFAPH